MRPEAIEKIARGVAAGVLRAHVATGCGAFSNPQQFTCPVYTCEGIDYQCGGEANFTCSQDFTCPPGFFCAEYYTSPE